MILQTRFSGKDTHAELSCYGSLERETMQAIASSTRSALDTTPSSAEGAGGEWRSSPFSSQVLQWVVVLPGSWECRRTLQNILRVAWLDVFERAGWAVKSAWNSDAVVQVASPRRLQTSRPHSVSEGEPFAATEEEDGENVGETANFLLFKGGHNMPDDSASSMAAADRSGGSQNGDPVDEDPGSPRSQAGLPLPDVVQKLLRERNCLRWDAVYRYYEVIDGNKFEERFNQLRKVRQKHKNGAVERPFSRMHNFFVLEKGDKWAKTGTVFRPKSNKFAPPQEVAFPAPVSNPLSELAARATSEQESQWGMSVLSGACTMASLAAASTPNGQTIPPIHMPIRTTQNGGQSILNLCSPQASEACVLKPLCHLEHCLSFLSQCTAGASAEASRPTRKHWSLTPCPPLARNMPDRWAVKVEGG